MHELPVLTGDLDASGCRCDGGQPKNFLRPCLLLLLAEAPAHGYELLERLRPFGFDLSDPATVYKTLRVLEGDGHVTSEWELSARGPARRVYSITDDGLEMLHAWTHVLAKNRDIIGAFIGRVAELPAQPPAAIDCASSILSSSRPGGMAP
jgi:PadR family transcriptional regulator, regulatory protein PadR